MYALSFNNSASHEGIGSSPKKENVYGSSVQSSNRKMEKPPKYPPVC